MKTSLLLLMIMLFGLARIAQAAEPSAARPNVLFILGDDVGLPWISCYGADSFTTPHIDALARSGIRFESCYATPFCGPTRAELITGRYPFRTGALGNGLAGRVKPADERPFVRLFRDAGYATGMCGKWAQMTGDLQDWGFDEHLTDPSPAGWFWETSYIKNGEEVRVEKSVYHPDVCHEFAVDFIRRHRERPFFFYYSSHFTHAPILRTPDSKPGGPEGESDEHYFEDNLLYLDKQVGQLVAEIERLKLRERTLIVFTGDNGSTQGHRPTAGLRGRKLSGGKGSMLEGGARVPLIVSWKGVTPANQVCRDLVDFTDFHATFCELAGIEPPRNFQFDGHSFAAQLRGAPGRRREAIFVQLRDQWYVRDSAWKLNQSGELFDMRDAPFVETLVPAGCESDAAQAARRRLEHIAEQLGP
jgi:arylsulfatase A